MHEHSVINLIKYGVAIIIPFVEPQIAGILGGLTYLIVRHELKMGGISLSTFFVVIFFGWMGAWATVNILAEYWKDCPHVWEHIISAIIGFLSYDAILMFGKNSKSLIGFFVGIAKSLIMNKVRKWNS